jgi:hypothetical protein
MDIDTHIISLQSWSECCESLLKGLTLSTAAQMNSSAQFCCDFVACSLKHSPELHPDKLGPAILLTKVSLYIFTQ